MAESRRPVPRDIVVMPRETPTPSLRASLRAAGMFIPPPLARLNWGPALIRERLEQPDLDLETGDGEDATLQPSPRQPPPPRRAAPESSPTPANPAERAASDDGYDAMPPDVGQYHSSSDADYASSYGGGASSSYGDGDVASSSGGGGYGDSDYASPPSSSGGGFGGGGGYEPPEPETRQLDVGQIDAIAASIGESTTQASHRAERLDLSDWGFLMRVVMLAGPDDPEPRRALDQLVPTIGEWLRAEVDQPARLEYDRRFRHEIQKQLARFLTEQLGRFPVIKAELQYIE